MVFLDDVELDFAQQPRFLELARNEVGGERRGVERNAQFTREIGDGADVVLVRVGEHDAEQVARALFDELEIGEHQVDARVFVAREGHAQIDHQPLAVAAIQVDVHADFARTSKGKEKQFLFG